MSLDYDSDPTGLFVHLGALAYQYHQERIAGQAVEASIETINAIFQDGGQMVAADSLPPLVASWQSQHVSRRQSLASVAQTRLLDRETILVELNVPSASISDVLAALIRRMVIDEESIEASVATVSIPTPATGNIGNGRLLLTDILDGRSTPTSDTPAHRDYATRRSELVRSERHAVACTSDSYGGGATAGREFFRWSGDAANQRNGVLLPDGSGDFGSITVAGAASMATNGGFETVSSNVPTGWTVASGVAGTNIGSDTATVYAGSRSLKLTGGTTVQLTQAIPTQAASLTTYCLAVRIRASAGFSLGTFKLYLSGTTYTALVPTVEVQTVAISGTPTDGVYYLTYRGYRSAAIPYNASSAQVQTALRGIPGLDCVVVDTLAGSVPNITHRVRFYGVPSDCIQLTSDESEMLSGSIAHATTTNGTDGDIITVPASAIPTSEWATLHCFVVLPESLPTDMKINILLGDAPDAGKSVFVDDLYFVPVTYNGGLAAVLLPGTVPFAEYDTFYFDTDNDEGAFQRFFREVFSVQLPSSATPTIDDALAT